MTGSPLFFWTRRAIKKTWQKKQRVGLHPYIDQQKPLFFETFKRFDRSAEKWVGNKIKKQQSSSKSVFISLSPASPKAIK